MKKIFFYMTLWVALLVFNSCNKSEDNTKNAQDIANILTSDDWKGYNQGQYREFGNWVNSNQYYVVLRFQRSSNTATNGTGYQLGFSDSSMGSLEGQSEFTWSVDNSYLRITYKAGWDAVYAAYKENEFVINKNNVHGLLYSKNDRRIVFDYTSTTFKEWDKYLK